MQLFDQMPVNSALQIKPDKHEACNQEFLW